MKRAALFLVLLATVLISTNLALALGIGPAKIIIEFQPLAQSKYNFIVVNEIDAPKQIELYVAGDEEASKYFNLFEKTVMLKPKETRGFYFTFNQPAEMAPGQHKVRIGAVESLPGAGQLGARIGVESIVVIEVPVPGKYIVVNSLEVPNIAVGQPLPIKLTLVNRGNQTVEKVAAAFDVLNSRGQREATVLVTESNIVPAESRTIAAEIKTTELLAGKYGLKAAIDYDGNKAEAEASFGVGERVINVLRVYGDDIKKGAIGHILVDYGSQWNDKIDGVHAIVKISNSSGIISQLQGQEFSVDPFGSGTTVITWDTRNVGAGEYDAQAILSYAGKTSTNSGKMKIVGFEITTYILAAILIILTVISLSYLLAGKRKK